MAKLLKLRRGTTSQHSSFTGAEGEVTIDTNKDVPVVHDGSTAGGHPVAAEDMSNVSSSAIVGRIGSGAIGTDRLSAGGLPANVTVASANIVNGTIVNGDVNASAAIAGSKITPNFTANMDVDGSITCDDIITAGALLHEGDTNTLVHFDANDQISLKTNGSTKLQVTNAGAAVTGNLDVSSGVDVTGNVEATGHMRIINATPSLYLQDSDANPDYVLRNSGGAFVIRDDTNGLNRLAINTDGHIDIAGNVDFEAGIDVNGNITCTGTVDGVDIAARNTLFGGLTSSSGVLSNGVTATTQSAGNNTTRIATTAFVTTAIANADAFPSGTKMLFQQTSAPTGWTKVTSGVDNKALRVVSGSASSGGSNAFSNTFASKAITANSGNTTAGGNVNVSVANSTAGGNISVANTTAGGNVSVSIANASTGGTVNNHTLTVSQMPSHNHGAHGSNSNNGGGFIRGFRGNNISFTANGTITSTGGGAAHNHGFTGSSHNHNANGSLSGSAHNHNASFSGSAHNHNASGSFSGSAHNHSISVTNLDMAVQYLDVIIAAKD